MLNLVDNDSSDDPDAANGGADDSDTDSFSGPRDYSEQGSWFPKSKQTRKWFHRAYLLRSAIYSRPDHAYSSRSPSSFLQETSRAETPLSINGGHSREPEDLPWTHDVHDEGQIAWQKEFEERGKRKSTAHRDQGQPSSQFIDKWSDQSCIHIPRNGDIVRDSGNSRMFVIANNDVSKELDVAQWFANLSARLASTAAAEPSWEEATDKKIPNWNDHVLDPSELPDGSSLGPSELPGRQTSLARLHRESRRNRLTQREMSDPDGPGVIPSSRTLGGSNTAGSAALTGQGSSWAQMHREEREAQHSRDY